MTTIGLYFRGLDREQTNALRTRLNQIAFDFGYYAERGPTAGRGNLAEMLIAIDAGELALVLFADGWFRPALEHLEAVGEEWADAIIASLHAALQRQAEADGEME